MPARAVPLVLLFAVAGCELLEHSPPFELPEPERSQVHGNLLEQGIDPATATPAQVLPATVRALEPLPVESARIVEDGEVEVVIAPITRDVLSQLLSGLGAGGIAGLAGGVAAGGVSLFMLFQKLRDLKKRAKKPVVAPVATAPVTL